MRRALEEPLRQIVNNSGEEGAVVVAKVLASKEQNYGYDALTGVYEDLVKAGIIDPTKVTSQTQAFILCRRVNTSQENTRLYHFTNAQLIIAVTVLVLVAIVVGEYLRRRKARTAAFHNRFGSEYDRAVQKHGSSQKAQAKLADRESRVHALKIRDLGVTERERFAAEWQAVQSRFLDYPEAAVTEADALIAALLETRGYPKDSFESGSKIAQFFFHGNTIVREGSIKGDVK